MTPRVDSDLLLLGSLPADSTEHAFRRGAELYGDLVFALPDGETGFRQMWIAYDGETLVRNNPGFELTSDKAAGRAPRHQWETPQYKLTGDSVHFERWPRIDDAIESYETFMELRADGVIPAHLRFQVCLPSIECLSLVAFTRQEPHEHRIMVDGFGDLYERELPRLLAAIPHEDLAIQWDCALEAHQIDGVGPYFKSGLDGFIAEVRRIAPLIPEDVLFGYHLCYGTFGGWPMYEARDFGTCVRMANAVVSAAGRPIDWFHLAGPRIFRSEDEDFYRPLTDLDVGDARVFLGLVLPADGEEGLARRHATASRFLADFGVAMYCGFGRQPGEDGEETMSEHARVVRTLAHVASR